MQGKFSMLAVKMESIKWQGVCTASRSQEQPPVDNLQKGGDLSPTTAKIEFCH